MKAGYVFTDFPYISRENELKNLKCASFILVSEKYGPMIFDTGSVYDDETLINFLKNNFNLYPLDIKWVFITHIHPDHVGANRLFKNAKIILSKNDFSFADKIASVVFKDQDLLSYLHSNCPGYISSFDSFEAERMKKQIKEKWSNDNIGLNLDVLFIEDNPRIPDFIKIIPSFGHTFYHYSYLLDFEEIKILVTGDALSMRMILRDNHEERLNEPHMDFDLYFKSLAEIKKFSGLIVPGHDRPFFSKNLRAIRKNKFNIKDIPHSPALQ